MVAAAVLVAGCGGSEPKPADVDYGSMIAKAPPRLKDLYGKQNELLEGGKPAFEKSLEQLRGLPVVVNYWASWCGGCREEFPYFQRADSRYGDRVAFVGVNSNDADEKAEGWLADYPVPYPSFIDGDSEIVESVGAIGLPATAFYDRDGKLELLKQGAYDSFDELRAEIGRVLLPAG